MRDIFSFAIDGGSVLIQISYFLVMVGGYLRFKSFEAILAATIPLGAVLGSILGKTLSPGFTFALVFFGSTGILVVILAHLFPRIVSSANTSYKTRSQSYYANGFDAPPQLSAMSLQTNEDDEDDEETEPLLGPINARTA